MNRQMVDCMADMYFAPTNLSKENLLNEGKDESKIFVTGNTHPIDLVIASSMIQQLINK